MAMFGFNSCSKDCDHEFIEHDHSADLVGTWTCLQEGLAEAFVIKADGSVVSTGVLDGEYWDGIKGSIKTVNNKMTFTFEGGDNYETRFDIIPGVAFSIFNEEGERLTYKYCANDLSDEVVGMWVCNDGLSGEVKDKGIITYSEDGKAVFTGDSVSENNDDVLNMESTYKVIGDVLFQKLSYESNSGIDSYMAIKLTYAPNGTSLGDIMTQTTYLPREDGVHESISSWLRVKQSLDLAGKKYDYIKTFVSNVKGLDKDIEFMGTTFNFAKMDGVKLDKMLNTLLFTVEFPDANTIKYGCHYNNEPMSMQAPIVVDGNKMTVKMSQRDAAYKDVDLYTFQDQDNSQMHMYMHSTAFVNFFGNMQVTIMEQMGQLDLNDAAAVKAVFDSIDEAVETINVSFVMTKAAK